MLHTGLRGKADPIWDTAFTTKFARKPTTDAPLVTPMGAANVITKFADRVAELDYLISTQHAEMASTLSEMKANGIDGFSLSAASSEDMESANIADRHLNRTPYAVRLPDETMTDPETGEPVAVPQYGDMVYIANMKRRIEWERFIYACGPVHRVRFIQMPDKTIGIVYSGSEKDPAKVLEWKRILKRLYETHLGGLPDIETIMENRRYVNTYPKAILALMTDEEYAAHHNSKKFGNEDPDPLRVEFHAEDARGKDDRGYAGPRGMLGIDDDDDEPFEWDEDEERIV